MNSPSLGPAAKLRAPRQDDVLAQALRPREARRGRRLALVLEGGGMRGAFSAGVQAGFADAGLPFDAFDALYGSSAGALNLMYWVSRCPRDGTHVYMDELSQAADPPFFLYRNLPHLFWELLNNRAVMNLHAVERAMRQARPIDIDAIRAHHAPIWFPITHADYLTTEFLDVRTLAVEEILSTLLAAASVPLLADPFDLSHGRFIDGACGAPLPVARALADGCTDLVVVLTLPFPAGPAWYETLLLYALAGRRGLHSRVEFAVREGRRARRVALEILRNPPPGVSIKVIAPPARLIRSLERDPAIIARAVQVGVAAGDAAVREARRTLQGAA